MSVKKLKSSNEPGSKAGKGLTEKRAGCMAGMAL